MIERILRVFFVLLGGLGLLLFLLLASITGGLYNATGLLALADVLVSRVFLPGLAPLIVAIYFFWIEKDVLYNAIGLLAVVLFIALHVVVSASGHEGTLVHLAFSLIEIGLAIVLVVLCNRSRLRRSPLRGN